MGFAYLVNFPDNVVELKLPAGQVILQPNLCGRLHYASQFTECKLFSGYINPSPFDTDKHKSYYVTLSHSM